MKEKLVVIAVTCAIASPAASQVVLSGKVNVGPYFAHSGAATPGASNAITAANGQDPERYKQAFSKQGVTSNNSFIALNSELEMGRWFKLVFQYQLDISETGASLASTGSKSSNTFLPRTRNSFLGIAGPWGALKFGTNENVYAQYLYEADPLDGSAGIGGNHQMFGTPGYGVVFDVGQMDLYPVGQAGFYRRTDQNVWYESPSLAGFSLGAAYSLNAFQKEATPDDGSVVVGTLQSQVISVGAQYKPTALPFYANVAFELHRDMFGLNVIVRETNNGRNSLDTGLKAQAGMILPFLTIGGVVEHLKYTVDAASAFKEYQRTAFGLHAKVNLPFGYFGLNTGVAMNGKYRLVAANSPLTTAALSGAIYGGLGYFHNVNDRTQIQVVGTVVTNQVNAAYAVASGATSNLRVAGADHLALCTSAKYTF